MVDLNQYPLNAKPDRIKYCSWCMRNLPIQEFLWVTQGPARTVLLGESFAWVVADVAEWCRECEASKNPKIVYLDRNGLHITDGVKETRL